MSGPHALHVVVGAGGPLANALIRQLDAKGKRVRAVSRSSHAEGPKGTARAHVAQLLMAAHASGRVRAAIARGADFFGPEVFMSAVGERVFSNALDRKPADLLGDIDQVA